MTKDVYKRQVLQSELETCRSDVEKMRERLRMTEEECGRVRLTKRIDNREKKPTSSELKPMSCLLYTSVRLRLQIATLVELILRGET